MIRVYIGTEDAQWLPTEVLKHSILTRSQSAFEFVELKNIPLKLQIKMYTGFSFYRFSIPKACNFEGRAIYLDADIVVLCDLKELIELNMGSHGVLARPQKHLKSYFTSVMLMDCERLKNWKVDEWVTLINSGIFPYNATMNGSPSGLGHKDYGPLAEVWNGLDEWSSATKILHYTHVPTQPWKKAGHPFAFLFLRELKSCLDQQVLTVEDVRREIAAGHVYSSILDDVEKSADRSAI